MRYFRRLPPLLRVASILGLLFPLASLALLVSVLVTSLPSFLQSPAGFNQSSAGFDRGVVIALNLGAIGGACSTAVNTYSTRFRQPAQGPFLLSSWQSQARAIGLLAALPLCALALAVFIPPTSFAFGLVVLITFLAAVALVVANILTLASPASSGVTRPPQAW
jgi:hypothetical protein